MNTLKHTIKMIVLQNDCFPSFWIKAAIEVLRKSVSMQDTAKTLNTVSKLFKINPFRTYFGPTMIW